MILVSNSARGRPRTTCADLPSRCKMRALRCSPARQRAVGSAGAGPGGAEGRGPGAGRLRRAPLPHAAAEDPGGRGPQVHAHQDLGQVHHQGGGPARSHMGLRRRALLDRAQCQPGLDRRRHDQRQELQVLAAAAHRQLRRRAGRPAEAASRRRWRPRSCSRTAGPRRSGSTCVHIDGPGQPHGLDVGGGATSPTASASSTAR